MNDPVLLLGYVCFGLYVLTSLWLVMNGIMQLHLLWHYKKGQRAPIKMGESSQLPFVTFQIPVYNEKFVIERLLKAFEGLDYPKEKFELQILDDSTDETSVLIKNQEKILEAKGINCSVIKRRVRTEFKAGALKEGMNSCKGDLIAIFDADFIPPPQFLKKLVHYFDNEKVGLVQAKWGHLNRNENSLTRIQTFLLDTHFSVEQGGRSNAGYFINFCGTAGIWRKQCIEEAGGWDGKVLSEDLDLSYRAQLKGWKLLYDEGLEVPAELPSQLEAFKVQQFRWTKGMAQVTRKNLKAVLNAPISRAKKINGFFHLLGSSVFVCLLINAVLTVPLLIFRNLYPQFITLTRYSLFTSLNLVALTIVYYAGTRKANDCGELKFSRSYPLFLVTYMALSVQNAIAVIQGFFGTSSVFIRTPKSGGIAKKDSSYLNGRINWINWVEIGFVGYFLFGIGLSIFFNDYFMMGFFLMIIYGLCFLLFHSFKWIRPSDNGKKKQPMVYPQSFS